MILSIAWDAIKVNGCKENGVKGGSCGVAYIPSPLDALSLLPITEIIVALYHT